MMEAFRNVFRSSAQKKEAKAKAEIAKAEEDARKREEEDLKERDVFAHGIETLFDKNRGEPIEYADADVFNDNRYVDYSEQQRALRKVETSVKREQNKLIGIADDYLTDEKDSGSEKEKRFDETEKENGRNGRKVKATKEAQNKAKERSWRDINVFGCGRGVEKKSLDEYIIKDHEPTEIEKETIKSALKTLETKVTTVDKNKLEGYGKSKGKETVKSTPKETVKSTPKETVKSTPKETVKSTAKEVKSTENEAKSAMKLDLKKVDVKTPAKTESSKTSSSVGEKSATSEESTKPSVKDKVTNFEKMKKDIENKATVVKPQPGVRSVRTTETTVTKTRSPGKSKVSSETTTSVRTVTSSSSRTTSSTISKKGSTETTTRRSSVAGKGEAKGTTKETTTTSTRAPLSRQTSAASSNKSGSHGNATTAASKVAEKGKAATGTPTRSAGTRASGGVVKEASTTVRKVTTVKRTTSGAKQAPGTPSK